MRQNHGAKNETKKKGPRAGCTANSEVYYKLVGNYSGLTRTQ